MGTKEETYTIISIFFGLWSFEADRLIRGGGMYFDEYGDIDRAAPFIAQPFALLVYWMICRGIMRD